jgi:hypothetical protein
MEIDAHAELDPHESVGSAFPASRKRKRKTPELDGTKSSNTQLMVQSLTLHYYPLMLMLD